MIPEPDGTLQNRHEDVSARRARERRVWRLAFVVSVAVHLVVFLLGPRGSIPLSSSAAAGPDQGDFRAAGGDMEVLALSSAPPTPIRRPALPILDVDLAVPELSTAEPATNVSLDLPELSGVGASSGRDPSDNPDAGLPGATGAGNAGTSRQGTTRVIPPSPRGIIIPPTNEGLRGTEVEVWVFVNEQGRVVADSTRLQPPTADEGFNQQLLGEAAQWVFEPARQNGSPIAAWFPYTISME